MLAEADAVVCAALFDGAQPPLFDAAAFAAMRTGALFVNVARGGLVDEDALLAALESGQVGGAGLDVYAAEPADPDWPLLRHPRVLATPHVGGLTYAMFRRTGEAFAANLRRWADGEPPRWAANEPAEAVRRRPPAPDQRRGLPVHLRPQEPRSAPPRSAPLMIIGTLDPKWP